MVKILYVEDQPALRNSLVGMLELSGFEVEVASDGREGIEKAISGLPDIILMDLRMPDMDGFEAIARIRDSVEAAEIPIIAMSAWADDHYEIRALSAGANAHLAKPVDLNRLLKAIRQQLASQ